MSRSSFDVSLAFESRIRVAATLDLDLRYYEPRPTDTDEARAIRRGVIERLPMSDAFYWSADVSSAVLASCDSMPNDTTVNTEGLPATGWMWFEKPWPPGVFSQHQYVHAMLWVVSQGMIAIITFGGDKGAGVDEILDLGLVKVHADESLATLRKSDGSAIGDHFRRAMVFWVASTLWIQQRILVNQKVRAERAARRRLGIKAAHEGWLNVVQLRRSERKVDSDGGDAAEWSCQWVVRGHWRQQFYPSKNQRRPLWIMPHVKGPEDAPLKSPNPTVFAVNR